MIYTCQVCKGTFESVWSDEEALAEFKERFPTYPFEKASVMCDDCYKSMMNYTRPRVK